jgi:predicted HicB family RNase H-like nuclease
MAAKKKVIFVRVDPELYEQIVAISKQQDRSINNVSVRLIKQALEYER